MPLPHDLLEHLHMVEAIANAEDTQLGLGPTMPPGPITQKTDPAHGTWADSHGIVAGSVIVFINNEYAEDMTQSHVISAFKARPLQIVFAPPLNLGPDVKKLGIGFNKPSTGRVRVGTVNPGGWGESVGLMTGDILMTVNHQITEKMDDKDFIHALQNRPVAMGIQRMRMSLLMELVSIGRLELEREEIELELVNMQGHIKDLEEKENESDQKVEHHLHEIAQLHSQLEAAESAGGDAAAVAATNTSLRGELDELVIKAESDADALEGLELQLKQAQEDVEALEKELDDAREREASGGDGHADADALRIITDDYHAVLDKLKAAEELKDELHEEVEQLKSENDRLQSQAPTAASSAPPPDVPEDYQAVVDRLKAMEEARDELMNEVEELNDRLQSQNSATPTAASSAPPPPEMEAQFQAMLEARDNLSKEVEELKSENQQLRSQSSATPNTASSASPSPEIEAQLKALQEAKDELTKQVEQLKGENERLRLQNSATPAAASSAPPPGVPADYHAVVDKLKAVEEARDKLSKEVEELKSETQRLRSQSSATPNTASSASPSPEMEAQLKALQEGRDELTKQIEQLKGENERLRLQNSATPAAASSAPPADAPADYHAVVDKLKAAEEARDKSYKEVERLKSENDGLRSQYSAAPEELHKKAEQLDSENDRLRSQRSAAPDEVSKEVERLKSEIDRLQSITASKLSATQDELYKEVEQLKSENDRLRSQASATHDTLQRETAELDSETGRLQSQKAATAITASSAPPPPDMDDRHAAVDRFGAAKEARDEMYTEEAAAADASARKPFEDGGRNDAGNVDEALQTALKEVLQAEAAWSKAASLIETAAGAQASKVRDSQERGRGFMLKSEVESLWMALNDQKSELKVSYAMPPQPEYYDGVLGHVPAPRRPRNFPVKESIGRESFGNPSKLGSGLESRAQRIRKEAEDLHAQVGRWRAGHGAPMAMNQMVERRGTAPGQYEDGRLIPFRQDQLDSIKAIRAGVRESVELLPLVTAVGQQSNLRL